MSLIKSISGIRGTIGGTQGENLTPIDVVKFAAAYAQWLREYYGTEKPLHVVIGRDARISGPMVSELVAQTLVGCGVHVLDVGLSTTPTVEMAVPALQAQGGIILTASHNPKQWNALKLLNHKGEFISAEDGARLLAIAENGTVHFASVDELGTIKTIHGQLEAHIDAILKLPSVDVAAIRSAQFKVVVDAVNSSGGIAVPLLLEKLGVQTIHKLYCEPTGHFPHNPEPLPEHLTDLSAHIQQTNADLGIVVDPDVDRLAFVCEDGSMFGEEYTLVAVADYVLKHTPGATVSNLSSTRALRDVTEQYGQVYSAAAVGEVNVVLKMKATHAVIGGEGNGGVIYPELHYGRDALVGIALFLSHVAHQKMSLCALKATYPAYAVSKNKIELTPDLNVDALLQSVKESYSNHPVNTEDGVRIDFEASRSWVHLRKSNTEPIIRIYAEAPSATEAEARAQEIIRTIQSIAGIKA